MGSMVFKRVASIEHAAAFVAGLLLHSLEADNRTLWMLSGGSCVAVAVEVSKLLEGEDLHNLYVTLVDERYGPVGHANSNWQQLLAAGMNLPGARLIPVLSGQDRATTTAAFDRTLQALLNGVEYRLGLFGVGADGHTAGILPGSPAVHADGLATSYKWADFERITMTPPAIAKLDAAVVYGVGHEKAPVFDTLETEQPIDAQPAQVLKTVADVTILNDRKGEEVT